MIKWLRRLLSNRSSQSAVTSDAWWTAYKEYIRANPAQNCNTCDHNTCPCGCHDFYAEYGYYL